MRTPSLGNRLLTGPSGIVFEVPETVASSLVGNKTAWYVDEAVPAHAAPPRPVRAEQSPSVSEDGAVAQPKRRGRPPKAVTVEGEPEQ